MADTVETQPFGEPDPSGLTKPGELHMEVHPPKGKSEIRGAATEPTPEAKPVSTANAGLMAEAYKRNLLPPDKAALYEEALKRGLATPLVESPIESGARTATETSGKVEEIAGADRDVDYSTGASTMAQIKLSAADNPTEARLALERLYGKGNTGQDKSGEWWVKEDGRKIAVFGGGPVKKTTAKIVSGIAATGPEAAGSIAGGVIGLPGGPLGAMVGAGVGGAIGKGLDDLRKWFESEYAKTPAEEAFALGVSGAANTAGEGAGLALGAGGRALMRGVRSYVGSKPESQAITRSLLGPGPYGFFRGQSGYARPPITSYAPKATALQYDVRLRNLVSGNPQREQNVKFAMQRLHDVLAQSGVPDAEIEEVFSSIIDPRRAVSTRGEGEAITSSVKKYIQTLETESEGSLESARKIVDQQEAFFEKFAAEHDPETVHAVFVTASQNARRQWGAVMTRAYDAIDQMVGGRVIIPTATMKKAAQEILAFIPDTNAPSIFREISMAPEKLSIKEAQRFRTRLFEQGESGNLTPGTVEHDYREVAKSFDAAMDPANAAGYPEGAELALEALAKADKEYAEGIAKYRDAKLNQMIRDFRNQKILDPEKFAASLFDTKSTFRINTYRQIVGGQAWRLIQAADTKNLLKAVRSLASEGNQSATVNGKALDIILTSRGKMLDAIYGQDTADAWRLYAKRLAAMDGKLSKEIFSDPLSDPSMFTQHLQTAILRREQLEDFAKNNVLRSLRRGGPEEVDAAIDLIIQPGQEAQLEHVISSLGEKEVSAIRSAAMKKALSGFIRPEKGGGQVQVSGEAIDNFLSAYTKREQELLFPNGLDRDLRLLADLMKELFPRSAEDMGASLAAAAIKGKIPFSVRADLKWLEVKFKGWLADRPKIIAAIAGLRGPESTLKRIRGAAMRATYKQFLNEESQRYSSTAQRKRAVNQ